MIWGNRVTSNQAKIRPSIISVRATVGSGVGDLSEHVGSSEVTLTQEY
jgi:hypothetical protein